jgi:hypothetical protein
MHYNKTNLQPFVKGKNLSISILLKKCSSFLQHSLWNHVIDYPLFEFLAFSKKVFLFKIWSHHIEINIGSLSSFIPTMWGLWERTYSCTSWNRIIIIMYLLKVMKSSFTYDSAMNNYVPCVTNYVWYCICMRELLYIWTYIPLIARGSQKQQHNKEHLKATSWWGAPKSNNTQPGMPKSSNTSRSTHKQHHDKELPSV